MMAGINNTATGFEALINTTIGSDNTATSAFALNVLHHLVDWHVSPPFCISRSQPSPKLARVKVGGSPSSSGSRKTVLELGAPPTVPSSNPNSRLGRQSPHTQGWVMEHT